MLNYLGRLSFGMTTLWCYVIWYLTTLVLYFDPSPSLWGTAAGISLLVGMGLLFSTTRFPHAPIGLDRWQVARFFMMPFAVSSFSGLVRNRGFVLILFPEFWQTLLVLGLCGLFCLARLLAQRRLRRSPPASPDFSRSST